MKRIDPAKARAKEPAIIKEFREFINRGNVMDLAIGVIVGGAFSKIVTSLVDNIVTPIVSMFIGGVDFADLYLKVPAYLPGVQPATIKYGIFLQNVVDFLVTAFVIFMIVRTINKFNERAKKALIKQEEKKEQAEKQQSDEQTKLLKAMLKEMQKQNK